MGHIMFDNCIIDDFALAVKERETSSIFINNSSIFMTTGQDTAPVSSL